MFKLKIALYVEGQGEQIFINQLILLLWDYTGIKIRNLKLRAYQNTVCKTPDFDPDVDDESSILFVITDVDGVGSLPSAIANIANKQHSEGFIIAGLRDLEAQDFNKLSQKIDAIATLRKHFQKALLLRGCEKIEEIHLFFAIKTVEAWMLAFEGALCKWAKTTKEMISSVLQNKDLEQVPACNFVKQIGKPAGRTNLKSYDDVTSFTKNIISRSEIDEVYKSKKVPSFNQFLEFLYGIRNSHSN